jgi:hypothetical protein
MSRDKDFVWIYCENILGSAKVKCKFCHNPCTGSIHRFKYDLAQIPSHDISPCPSVEQDVKHQVTKPTWPKKPSMRLKERNVD